MKNNLKISNPDTLYDPTPHGYSHIASISPNSKLIYVSGQMGSKIDGVLSEDFRTQVKLVFENLRLALESEGLKMDNIAKLTTLVVDYDERKHAILIEESLIVWPDKKFPANTLIPVQRLALNNMLLEIDATAVA